MAATTFERPRVPGLVTFTTVVLIITGAGFGLAGLGNLFFGRSLWFNLLGPIEAACCVALVIAAVQLRQGNRRWWMLAFPLVALARAEPGLESWIDARIITPNGDLDWTTMLWVPLVWILASWALLASPPVRRHLRAMEEWQRQEAEHSAAGHFTPNDAE